MRSKTRAATRARVRLSSAVTSGGWVAHQPQMASPKTAVGNTKPLKRMGNRGWKTYNRTTLATKTNQPRHWRGKLAVARAATAVSRPMRERDMAIAEWGFWIAD